MNSFSYVNFANWYQILHQIFFERNNFSTHYVSDILANRPYYIIQTVDSKLQDSRHSILFFDQEPIHTELIHFTKPLDWFFTPGNKFFVTSEKSTTVSRYTQGMKATSIYYFFHAIAANEWYHHYRWIRPQYQDHQHLFVSYNNLINPYRTHRVDFLCRLYDRQLAKQGLISFQNPGEAKLEEIVKSNEWYTADSLRLFNRYKPLLTSRYIDTDNIAGSSG